MVKPEANGRLSITEYRKPTHTDQYIQWDSHHHISAKYSVTNTLTHRAKQFAINLSFSKKKWNISGKYPLTVSTPNGPWTGWKEGLPSPPVRLEMRLTNRALQDTQPTNNETKTKGHIVIPYTQGPCKSTKKICSRYGILTQCKCNSTIKNLLVPPRTRNLWKTKVGPSTGFNGGTLHAMRNT